MTDDAVTPNEADTPGGDLDTTDDTVVATAVRPTVPMQTRGRTYVTMVGIIVALLAAGLAIPAVVGEREADLAATTLTDLDLDALGPSDGATTPTSVGDAGPDGTTGGSTTGAPVGGDGRAGTSTGGPGAGGPATAPTVTTPVVLTASDVGVTPETIKLGLLVPTADGIGATQDQRDVQIAEMTAYTEEVNDNGGIHGRRIEVVTASYDVLDQGAGARAACLRLAEDEKVFAVVNTTGFGPPGALCLTREKGVPFFQGSGHPEEVYAQSAGLYSSTFDNQTRNFRNMVAQMHALGALENRVGVLGTEWLGLRREQEDGIVKTLRNLGYDPFVYWLSGDPVSSQGQIPIALLQMRNAGVKTVLLGADFLSGQSFVTMATSQGFRPQYGAADPWGYSTDQIVSGFGEGFDGAITSTSLRSFDFRVGVAEPAIDAACAEVVRRRTGLPLDRANDGNAFYIASMYSCGVIDRFVRAATAAGPELTRAGVVAAIPQLGTFDVPFSGGPATYAPGKLDGVDYYRPQRWRFSCTCWTPLVAQFARGEF